MFDKNFNPRNQLKVRGNHNIWEMNVLDGTDAYVLESALADNMLYEFERFSIPQVYLNIAKNAEEKAVTLISSIR